MASYVGLSTAVSPRSPLPGYFIHLRNHLVRAGTQEETHERERVNADVEQCTACELAIKKAIMHIVRLVAAEMHRDGAQRAEFPRPRRLGEPLADGHVADFLRLRKHDAMGTRERDGLRELVTDDAEHCPAIANLIFIYLLLSMRRFKSLK